MTMDNIRWDCLLDDSIKERVVEQWLWNADIAGEMSSGTADLEVIKCSLFACLTEYQKSRAIQCRSYQLLQDLQLLSDKIIHTDEAGFKYMTIIQNSLVNWAAQADVISGCFQFLAMTFEKQYDNISDLVSTQLLETVYNALNFHRHSKRVQLPGIQIFYQLLKQSITGSLMISKETLEKIISNVIYNMRFMNDDLGIINVCCSALDIVVRKIAPEALAPFIDELVSLVADLFSRYNTHPEIASACLLILEKLVVEDRHMMTFCSSSDVLLQICDSLNVLRCEVKYNLAMVAAFHLFNQALTDQQLLSFVLDENPQVKYDCISLLQNRLMEHVGNIPLYCNSMNLSPSLESKLVVLVNGVFLEVRELLLDVALSGAVSQCSSPAKERAESYDFERHIKVIPSSDLDDTETDIISVGTSTGRTSPNIFNHNISQALYGDGDEDIGNGSSGDIYHRSSDETDSVSMSLTPNFIDNYSESDRIQSDSHDSDGLKYVQSISHDVCIQLKENTVRTEEENALKLRNQHDANVIVEVAQLSQQQAVVAMVRADLLHRLFKDATRKIEVLMKESDGLRTKVGILQDMQEEAAEYSVTPTLNEKSKENISEDQQQLDAIDTGYQVSALETHVGSVISDFPAPSNGRNSSPRFESEEPHTPFRKRSEIDTVQVEDVLSIVGGRRKETVIECEGVTTVDVMLLRATMVTIEEAYSKAIEDLKGDKRIFLAVAGTLEALSVLTLANNKESRYETAQSKTARKNLIQSGKGSSALDEKYDEVDGHYYVGEREAVLASTVQDLALIALHMFNHLKVSEMTSSTGLLKQTALSLTSLRNLLRNLQVFLMRDVDILLSHLAVTHLSIAGFSYALMACVIKRYPKASTEELIAQLGQLLKAFWMTSANRLSEPKSLKALSPGILSESEGQLSPQNLAKLLLALDKEKSALRLIFNAYVEAPRYLSSGSIIREKSPPLKMTQCARNMAANHAFIPAVISGGEGDVRSVLPARSGVSLTGIAHFSQDFDLSPVVIELPQLFRIFGDVFAEPTVTASSSSCSSPKEEEEDMKGGDDEGCSDETDMLSEIDTFSMQSARSLPFSRPLRPASDLGEPLLTFRQFQALIIAVALKSSYLRCDSGSGQLSPSKRHSAKNVNNGQYQEAVLKVNRLLTWLNQSRGKDRLTGRVRTMSFSVLSFRLIA